MNRYFGLVCLVVLLACMFSDLFSQNSVLLYREREVSQTEGPLIFSHGLDLPIFLSVNRLGVFTLSGPSFTPIEVLGMKNSDGYEFHEVCDCKDGGFLLKQRGFLGGRLSRLDDSGVAHKITLDRGEIKGSSVFDNGVASLAVLDTNGVGSNLLTLDCGQTWFEVNGNPIPSVGGAAILQNNNPLSFSLARPGLGNEVFPSGITRTKSAGLSSIAILGRDSVVWCALGKQSSDPDTIWYANIRDRSMNRFDTVLPVNGMSNAVSKFSEIELVATYDGLLFAFHKKSGWYARYNNSSWTVVDTLPPMALPGFKTSLVTSVSDTIIRYKSSPETGGKLVTVHLDAQAQHNEVTSLVPLSNPITLTMISSIYTFLQWNKFPLLYCLYNENDGLKSLNSIVRGIDRLPVTPILFGFTSKIEKPIVVPYHDCPVLVTESGIGMPQESFFRGEEWHSLTLGPRIQSTRGLRTPFVGRKEVIAPGDKVRQFTRDGRFVQVLRDKPATAVFRMPDTTLLIADGAVVTVLRAGGLVDSVDITPVLCSTSAVAGYVNSITMAPDGSLLAFTNGLRLLDLETFGNKPWHCGGIVRSIDTGRTWVKCTSPVETPYFLGSIRTSTGVLVASVSTVVRDTTKQVSDDIAPVVESKNHTFNDRTVIRSTDNGATWTQVYHSPSKSSFKLIGGDGTITKDGTLLLMTTDGVLQSTNDGLDWDFRDITGLEAGSQNVISMFQDTVGSAVYYCTINGLYEEQPLTTVHEENSTATNVHAARTWESHLSAWKKSGIKIKRLISILGFEVPTVNPPAGLYLAEYELHSETMIEPILVLVD
ncbi:MAG: exo-alpha-sialidase [Ignavibacteria bacterium]|nr:exo-alpha-sialidase [Ignavibacteria bacterium]